MNSVGAQLLDALNKALEGEGKEELARALTAMLGVAVLRSLNNKDPRSKMIRSAIAVVFKPMGSASKQALLNFLEHCKKEREEAKPKISKLLEELDAGQLELAQRLGLPIEAYNDAVAISKEMEAGQTVDPGRLANTLEKLVKFLDTTDPLGGGRGNFVKKGIIEPDDDDGIEPLW